MGKILFIRVSANTYSDEDMQKEWPSLYKITISDAPKALKWRESGVMGLITALVEGIQFSLLPSETVEPLRAPVATLASLQSSLNKALSDHDVVKAKVLTNEIESALDIAEKALN